MKMNYWLAITGVSVLSLLVGCGVDDTQTTAPIADAAGGETQVPEAGAKGPESAAQGVDTGTFTGSVYRNEFFGMSMTFPDNWIVLAQEIQDEIANDGADMWAGDDAQRKAALESSKPRATQLFAVFEFPLDAAVEYNPCVTGGAMRLEGMGGVASGADYNFLMRRLLSTGQVDAVIVTESESITIGGRLFNMMSFDVEVMGVTARQKSYAFVADGQALSITLSFASDEQEAALEAILATVEFE